ncbi:DUF3846 domain-containing protein [Streptomyces lavendulae]|uniref:DUF3846 domain-containing protein n=1 Tax=Streptomyces lavendulae TaxID=1914 RepID=UPI0024A5B744|nr:DUF3846 domain-containing protein [Streptomyces lavendulae]GLW04719.1 hypothetical protein Slala05_83490 [Streptomyces lavendulae subsp. lavendulae]
MPTTKAVEPFALVIQPDGWFELADWTPATTAAVTLGCELAHPVTLTGVTLWVDQEALVHSLPVNVPAMRVLRVLGAARAPYFGPVLFTGPTDHLAACGADGLTQDQALALIEQYLTRTAVKIPQQRQRTR